MIKRPFILLFLTLILLLPACRQKPPATGAATLTPAPSPTPIPPTPTPTPAEILQRTAELMINLDTAHFAISRSGAPAFLPLGPGGQPIQFNNATGLYKASDNVELTLNASLPGIGLVFMLNSIAIGDSQWLMEPLSQQWSLLPPNVRFNPAILFNPEDGWTKLLNENVTQISAPESVTLDGTAHLYLTAELEGARVAMVTAGAVTADEPVMLEIWIAQKSGLVTQIKFNTPAANDQQSEWLLRFSKFNEPVTITAPAIP